MKKLLCMAALAGGIGCHSAPVHTQTGSASTRSARSGSTDVGAATEVGAIQLFFDAVRSGDLQAMSLVWGTKNGPTRDHIPGVELEKREVILQCYFKHDSYRILSPSPDQTGGRSFKVELKRDDRLRTTTVSVIQGPARRWFVQSLDINAVRDFCTTAPTNPQ